MNYHNITYPDMNNGNGLRVVLWLSGCNHYCKNCQNPQTWDENGGVEFDDNAKKEIFDELKNDYISGITLSGGDPLYHKNVEEVFQLLIEIKKEFPSKNIWLYTGYTWEQILYPIVTDDLDSARDNILFIRKGILGMCDVLVDGEYKEELRDVTLPWRGSSNQRVIDVQKSLREGVVVEKV